MQGPANLGNLEAIKCHTDTIYEVVYNSTEMLRTVHKNRLCPFTSFGLTTSYVLIFTVKVNMNVLYKAVYLSKSIRPNKYPKIESQILKQR